jgi:hypothetical protein
MRAYCPIERCGWARKRLGKRYRPFRSSIFDSQASQHGHIAPRLIESATRSVGAVSRPDRQLSSHETRRWREPDSNHRFRVTRPRFRDRLTSLLPDCRPTEARREREPTPRECRAPSAGPMVRILFRASGGCQKRRSKRSADMIRSITRTSRTAALHDLLDRVNKSEHYLLRHACARCREERSLPAPSRRAGASPGHRC